MRFLEIPALITEDIETPDIVDITEPITASISGTTLTIDGGNKVSGESTITLTSDVHVNTINKSNLREPSIHKISVKTNGKGNFTYTPNTGVTASSVSSTIKTGSDFEILLITTSGGDTYLDLDLADYTSPAVNFSNALTGFDISDLTSTYGATAKLYKPDGTLLSTTSSATIGSGVGFGAGVETTPQEVNYKLEVTDDVGRKSTYNLPRKWINYAMETNSTPGFQKFKLGTNEYTSTTVVPNLSSTTKARVYKTIDHGYLGINFKIQGRNSTSDAWTDIDSTAENVESDESAEFLAFGDYLYQRVWVKPTAQATTIVSSSNVVTLTLSNVTEDVTKTISGKDPYSIDEVSNTYVFDETSRVGTVPFTVTLGSETYTDSVTATTLEMGGIITKTFHTENPHTVDESDILYKHLSIDGTTWQVSGSTDGKWITHCDGSGHPHFYKGSPESGYTYTQTKNNGQGSTGTLSYDGLYHIGNKHSNTNATLPILKRTGDTFNDHSSNLTKPSSENYGPVAWSQNSYNFAITNAATETIYFYEFDSSDETWSTTWNSGSLTGTLGDLSWFGRMSARLSKDGEYLVTGDHSPENTRIWKCDWTAQTVTLQHTQTGNSGCAAIDYDGEYVIAGYNSANTKILKRSGTTWTDVTTSEGLNTLPYNRIGAQFLGVPSQYLLTGEYQTPGVSGSYHTFLYKWREKKATTLTYNGKDKLTIAHKGGITPSSVKLYKDGVLYHTFGTELSIFINETGVYQAISDDTYYSSKVTVTTITETEARLYINHATTFLLKKDGKVWYWGESHRGSNAMGNGTEVALPTLNDNLNALPSGIKQIGNSAVDPHACCGITNDGKLYTWGYNAHSQLGRGNSSDYTSQGPWLVDTQSSNTFTFCHSSYYSNFALQDNGYLWSCGYNGQYVLGTGNNSEQNRFYRINLPNVIDFHCNHDVALAVTNENKVYIWGTESNSWGQMGGATGTTGTPTHMTALDGKNIVKVRTAGYSGHAISSDGKLYSWGRGGYYAIPDGTGNNVSTPTEMTWFSRKSIKLVDVQLPYDENASCLGLDDQGNMYVWGVSDNGSSGDYTPNYTYQWPVLLKTNIASIAVGRHSCGCIDKFGQVYTWGDGDRGVQNWIHGTNSDTDIHLPTSNNLSVGTSVTYDGSDRYVLGKGSTSTSNITFGSNTVSLGTKSEVFVTDPHTYNFKIIDTDSVTYTSNVVSTVSRPTGRVYPPKSGTHKNITTSTSANGDNTWTIDGALYGSGAYKASMDKPINGTSEWAYNAFNGLIGYTHVHTNSGNPTAAIQLHMPQKIKLTKYAMYSRNFTGEYTYAPKDWKVYGSNDNGTNWTELDSQTNETVTAWGSQIDHRDTKREYTVTGNTKYFSSYKLDVTANGGDGNYVVLSQIEYYGDEEGLLSDDGFGKLTLDVKGDTNATSNITFHSNTFVMGAARDLYIKDLGEYSADIYGSSKAFLGSKTHTVSANATEFAWKSTEDQIVYASDAGANDHFGSGVWISGDYAIVGAYAEDDIASDSGAAYIFHKSGGTWTQQAKLKASDAEQNDYASGVSIDGDYAILGAYAEDTTATNSGAAYIFKRNGTSWTEQSKLKASDAASHDEFGLTVAISGDYALVGANSADQRPGSAYVFNKTLTTLTGTQSPYFTDASTIVTNSNWSSSTGFEITSGGDSSTSYSQKWRAFDNTYTHANPWESTWLSTSSMPAWLQIQYPQDVVVKSYTIVGRDATDRYIPTSWQLQGVIPATKTSIAITGGIYYNTYTGCYYELDSSQNTENSRFFELKAANGTPQFGTPEIYGFEVRRSGSTYTAYANTGGNTDEPNELSITSTSSGMAASVTLPTTGRLYGRKQANYGTFETESVTWADVFDTYVNLETTGGNRTASSWAPLAEVSHDVNTPNTAYRSFRLYVNSSNENNQVSINELKLFTTPLSGQSNTVEESWSQQAKLQASDGATSDRFGRAVALSGNYAIVGAYCEDTGGSNAGSAYIFKRNEVTSSTVSEHPPSALTGTETGGGGGYKVTSSSDAYNNTGFYNWKMYNKVDNGNEGWHTAGTYGSTSPHDHNNTQSLGGVSGEWNKLEFPAPFICDYVIIYRRSDFTSQSPDDWVILGSNDDSSWTQLVASTTLPTASGATVQISDTNSYKYFAIVVKSLHSNGEGTIGELKYFGYMPSLVTWSEQAKIQSSDIQGDDRFGECVDIDGEYAIISAPNEDTGASNLGSVYIFKKNTGAETWSQQAKLQASDKEQDDKFGGSDWGPGVSISGNIAVVGAHQEDTGGANSGAAYIFERSGTAWTEVKKITASNASASTESEFGMNVGIDGNNIIVAAYKEDTKGTNAGAVYMFEKAPVAVPTLTFDGYNKLSIGNIASKVSAIPYFIDNTTVSTGESGWEASESSFQGAQASEGGEFKAYKAFDGSIIRDRSYDIFHSNNSEQPWIKIKSPNGFTFNQYKLTSRGGDGNMEYTWHPAVWTIDGSNDDSTWTTIDTQNSYHNWGGEGITHTFDVTNTTPYTYYRLNCTDSSQDDGNHTGHNYLCISQWELLKDANLDVTVKKDGAAFATTTSNTIYIRETGTYTAEVKTGSEYVTELSKVVSATPTQQLLLSTFSKKQTISGSSFFGGAWADQCGNSLSMNYAGTRAVIATGWGSGGNVYIYHKDSSGTWSLDTTLTAPSSISNFGHGVDMSSDGNRIFVIRGVYNTDAGGRIFVYDYSSGWSNTPSATLSEPSRGNGFARRGYCSPDGNTCGLVSTGGNDRVYTWKYSSGSWQTTPDYIETPSEGEDFGCGFSFNTDGTRMLVGAKLSDEGGTDRGRAYICDYSSGWTISHDLAGQYDGENFGEHVRINGVGTRAAIGARYNDEGGTNRGRVYIWDRDSGTGNWSLTQDIASSAVSNNSDFGADLFMNKEGDRVIIGASRDDTVGTDRGSVHVYDRQSNGQFTFVQTMNGESNSERFGFSIGSDEYGNSMLIGAPANNRVFFYESSGSLSPSLTYDGKNKLTIGGCDYADTSKVTKRGGTTYDIGTAKTMYVKETGDYDLEVSGSDKFAAATVNVGSVDLAGATTKPIDFDGFNKLTLVNAGANAVSNVTISGTKHELGSATSYFIKDTGTYTLEMSGSNVFALSSNVVGSINSSPEPGDISGLTGWYKGSSYNTSTNQWEDVSGNNRHMTEKTGTLNINSSGINGEAYVYADRYSGIKVPTTAHSIDNHTPNYTFFFVGKWTADSNIRGRILEDVTPGYYCGWYGRQYPGHNRYTAPVNSADGKTTSDSNITGDDWALITDFNNGFRINGTDRANATSPARGGMTQLCINNGYYNAGSRIQDYEYSEGCSWAGAEMICYNRVLTPYEISLIESYLQNKYSISNDISTSLFPSLTFDGNNKLTVSNFTTTDKEWPPSDGTRGTVTRTNSNKTTTWTISGASYGNGEYTAETDDDVWSSGSHLGYPDMAFNKSLTSPTDQSGFITNNSPQPVELRITLPNAIVLGSYKLQGRARNDTSETPGTWTMEGSNDGTTWTVIDTQTAANPALDNSKTATYAVSGNSTAYNRYKLNITATNAGSATIIGELYLYEQNTRTGTLTDPSGSVHTLGQTQDTFYIRDTGNYTLDVRNNDQKAIVTKNVGTIGPNTTSVFTPVQLDSDLTTDPSPGSNRSFRWQSTTGTKHYYRGYNGNTIDSGPMLIYYDTSDKKWYDGDTADHPNSFVVTTTQAVPSLSGATDPSSATGTSNAEYIHCVRINGTHLFSFKMAGWVSSPSLNFDGYNKLSFTNTDSDATSNIEYFSNTYEMGSRKELIVNDEGTYYANIHSSNTLALVKKELPYTELSPMTVSFKYCPGGRTENVSGDSNQVECYVYSESTGAFTSSTPFLTWGPDNDASWNTYSGTFTPPSSGNYRLVWKLTTGNHVPDTGWDDITFGGTTWNFENDNEGFQYHKAQTLNISNASNWGQSGLERTNGSTANGSYTLIPQQSPQSYYIYYDGSYDNNNNNEQYFIISPIVSSTTETITISGDTPANSATFNLRYKVTGDSESRMPELSIVNGLGTHTWSKTSSFTDKNGTEYDWMFIGEEGATSTTSLTTVALPYTVSVEVITGSPNSGFTERIWNGRGSSTDNTEQKNCNTVNGIVEIKGTYTSAIAPTYLLVSFTSGAKSDQGNGHLKAIDVIVSGKTYFSIDLGTTYGIAGDLMENYPVTALNQSLFAIKLPNKLFGLPELKFDGFNKLTPPVLEPTFTATRISDWDNNNQSKTTVTGGGDWPDATMTHHQVLHNGDKSYQHTDGGASRDAAQLFTTVISGDWGHASHGQAIHSPMWFGYKFTEGKKSVSKMILTQPPGNSHTTGNVSIKYWDGSAMVDVSNQSPTAMSSQSYNASTTFTFDSVSSQYWQIDCYKGSSNSTSYTALHGWQLYSGRDPVSTVITKGSDSYDIGKASSIYINAAGTYDAQAKNSNTFVIKARNTVSGTLTRKREWKSDGTESKILFADDQDTNTQLGYGCDIDGDYMIGGAPQDDEGGSSAGAAYIFHKSGGTWTQQAKLTASDPDSSDQFGEDCEISGDYAIVGNYLEDAGGGNAGAAYIYKRSLQENPDFTANSTLHTNYSTRYGWSSNSGWEVSAKDVYTPISGTREPWVAFSKSNSSLEHWLSNSAPSTSSPQWIQIKYPSQQVIKSYIIKTRDDSNIRFPTAWKLQGSVSDGTTWVDIGSEQTESTWPRNTVKSYDVSSNTTAYQYYRLRITGGSDATNYLVAIGEWKLFTGTSQTYWTEQAKLMASNAGADDLFGLGVSISGDYAIVGAPNEDTVGTNGGSAYIYKRSGSHWEQQAHLQSSDIQSGDSFGEDVSISGDYAVVGANYEDTGANNAGAAYVFKRTGTTWSQQAKIQASDPQADDYFGGAVAIDGDTIAIGTRNEDDTNTDSGAVYIFKKDTGAETWSQQAKLKTSDASTSDHLTLNRSISISGDTVIAGAEYADPDGVSNAGAAYVWERSGTTWTEVKKFIASDKGSSYRFGMSVGVSGNTAVVGSAYSDQNHTNNGALYVFEKSEVGPTLTYDDSNKLSLSGVTTPSTNLTFGTRTFDLGAAKDVYISDQGTYSFHTNDGSQSLLMSKTVSSDPSTSGGGAGPNITLAFHDGTFADSGDPHSDGSITTAATNGHVYSDTPTGVYTWGTLSSVTLTAGPGNFEPTGGNDSPPSAGNTVYKWTPASAITNARTLVVAGGGGGGADMGGGGGAGGLLASTTTNIAKEEQTIQVGGGGTRGHRYDDSNRVQGGNGADSSISGPSIIAIGGGGGATAHNTNTKPAGNGGSGGGGSGGRGSDGSYGGERGTGTAGQGYDGARSGHTWYPAGGGGASGMGYGRDGQGGWNVQPHGGDGVENDILGTSYWWAGGGGGNGHSTSQGNGGKGGGGGGAMYNSTTLPNNDTNGLTTGEIPTAVTGASNNSGGSGGKHTGGGGGGSEHSSNTDTTKMRGGRGGSGIVVIVAPTITLPNPSQAYDTSNTFTISNIPSGTGTVGKIYKDATAYTIHATQPTSNVVIKNTGSYLSVFTTSSTTYFTNTITVSSTPDVGDNTIEDEVEDTSVEVSATIAFHDGTFADSDDPHSDGSITAAATAGHIYSDTATGTYTWGTLTSCERTAMANNEHSTENWAYRNGTADPPTAGFTTYKWTPPGAITNGRTLVVAGGGGGGTDMGGGGGAGGMLASTTTNIAHAEQTIQVGGGGSRGYSNQASNMLRGGNGADSSISGPGITSIGGGGGASKHNHNTRPAGNGGSGGGGSGGRASDGNHGGERGTGTPGQGHDGARSGNHWYPAGGGGAGEKGYGRDGSGGTNHRPHGGNGLEDDILGTSYWWAGGGGGNSYYSGYAEAGHGGKGGGGGGAPPHSGHGGNKGNGDTNGITNGKDGDNPTANWHRHNGGSGGKHTGGGGGGGDHHDQSDPTLMRGGLGGSGIVAIKFTAMSGTKGIAGSTAIGAPEPVADAPSVTLDATTEVATPTMNLNFTTAMTSFPKSIGRYNISTHDTLGVVFDRTATRKKRVKKTINTDKFSMELTANNIVSESSTALPVTVSGGKFSISGSETPVLTLIRGKTYVFDQSDSTNGTHPLRLSTTSNGTHGSGSQYTSGWTTSGTPGNSNATRTLAVASDAPDTLYYYCQNHSGMGGTINVITHNLVTFGNFTLYANATVSGEHTIATNFDGTTSNVYVNGDLITSASTSVTAGAKLLTLGEYYSGRIKDFKFWNLAKLFFAPGLLDLYSLYNDTDKIASAYGFRLLFKEYTGAHAKIKRSSDNAELDVTFTQDGDIKTPSNFTTWKGSDTLYVTKWYDQSGRGLDVTPTNSSTPPVFDNAQVGGHFSGKWGALFDGASNDNELKVDNYTNIFGVSSAGQQKYTIFCSAYWDGGTSNDTMFAIGRTADRRNVAFHPNSSGSFNHYHFGADVTGTGISDETSLTLCLRYAGEGSNSTNMKQWFDTTLQSGSGSTSGGLELENNYPLRIGGYSTRGSAHYYEGRIFNFIALRTDRTDSEVTDIIGKLNTY